MTANDVINRLRRPLGACLASRPSSAPVQDIGIGGRAGNASVQFVLLSPDLEGLEVWSEKLVNRLRTVPGIQDVSSDQQRAGLVARLTIDREKAARLGVSVQA